MVSNVIKVGNRVELSEYVKIDEKIVRKVYLSQISDIVDENTLFILMPTLEGRLIPLPIDGEYEMCINSVNGLHNCRVLVTKRLKSDNILMLELSIKTPLKRYQRREYYRLEIGTEFVYKVLTPEELEQYAATRLEPDTVKKKAPLSAVTVDLSGGGMKYLTRTKNEKGSKILIYVNLNFANNRRKQFMLLGHILASRYLENRDGIYEERLEFSDIPKEDREDIIKYIFEIERARRQKERG